MACLAGTVQVRLHCSTPTVPEFLTGREFLKFFMTKAKIKCRVVTKSDTTHSRIKKSIMYGNFLLVLGILFKAAPVILVFEDYVYFN